MTNVLAFFFSLYFFPGTSNAKCRRFSSETRVMVLATWQLVEFYFLVPSFPLSFRGFSWHRFMDLGKTTP